MTKDYIYYCISPPTKAGNLYMDIEGYALVEFAPPLFADDLSYDLLGHYVDTKGDLEPVLDCMADFLNKEFLEEIREQVFQSLIDKLELDWRPNEHRLTDHDYGLERAV